jgi:hypothetical protein
MIESENTPNTRQEPNFESWVGDEERMHERRRQIVSRAIEYGQAGWMFAPAFTWGDSKNQEHSVIALATLVSQGYLASDLDNPHFIRVTEAGQAWYQAQAEAAQAEADMHVHQ